jgi:hypothetical protein
MQKRMLAADLLVLLACLLSFSLFSWGSPIRDFSIEDKFALGSLELHLTAAGAARCLHDQGFRYLAGSSSGWRLFSNPRYASCWKAPGLPHVAGRLLKLLPASLITSEAIPQKLQRAEPCSMQAPLRVATERPPVGHKRCLQW